jgi:hypothetical protein
MLDSYLNSINSLKKKSGDSIENNKKLKDTINEIFLKYGSMKKQIEKTISDVISFFIRRNQ